MTASIANISLRYPRIVYVSYRQSIEIRFISSYISSCLYKRYIEIQQPNCTVAYSPKALGVVNAPLELAVVGFFKDFIMRIVPHRVLFESVIEIAEHINSDDFDQYLCSTA